MALLHIVLPLTDICSDSLFSATSPVYSHQAGYRSGPSDQTALLKLTDNVREAIDENKVTILVFFDLSKAFDSISHPRLSHKLRNFSVSNRVVAWFYLYLSK